MEHIHKNQHIRHSFVKLLTGSDLSERRLPRMEAVSDKPGPVVWLTSCAHGDAVGGMVIIQEIFKKLAEEPLLRGTVHSFPLMNPIGFETQSRSIPLSNEDLNRCYPGNRDGSLAERITHKIFTTIYESRPSIVLDLHNAWKRSIPFTVVDPYPGPRHREVYEKIKLFARKTGFIPIGEQKRGMDAYNWYNTLTGSLILKHVPALTLEIGESYVVNEKNVEYGIKSILNILSWLEMIKPVEKPFYFNIPRQFRGRILKYSQHPVTSTSGIIRFLLRPGEVVRAGQPVATIFNAFGEKQETLSALKDGIVLGYEDSAVGFPGLPVMSFGVMEKERHEHEEQCME